MKINDFISELQKIMPPDIPWYFTYDVWYHGHGNKNDLQIIRGLWCGSPLNTRLEGSLDHITNKVKEMLPSTTNQLLK